MNSEQESKDIQSFPNIIGLQKQEDLLLKYMKNDGGVLVVGLAGVGKTLLIKEMARKFSSSTNRWQYLHASELVAKGGAGLKQISDIFTHFSEKDTDKEQQLILVIDEVDVLAEFRKQFCESIPNIIIKASSVKRHIVLIGLTNRPRYLGQKISEFFKNRIQIPLPSQESRRLIFKEQFKDFAHALKEEDFADIAAITDKFTPSDLVLLARTASHIPLKKFISAKSYRKVDGKYVACQNEEGEGFNFSFFKSEDIELDIVGKAEVLKALEQVKPSFSEATNKELKSYVYGI